MIVKLLLAPLQPLATGVTVIVDTTGVVPVFIPAKLLILPVPLADKPIDVVLFVQLYTVPETVPLKFTADIVAPLHTV